MEVLDGVIRPADVVVLIATGTHRASTADERREMLGDEVLAHVAGHRPRRARSRRAWSTWAWSATSRSSLAREWVEADLRITTGFVEPHFFAGFSGGPKMVAPGPRRPRDDPRAPRRPPDRRPAGRPGASSRATRSMTRSGPSRVAVRVDFSLDVLLDDPAADHPRVRRRDARDARGRLRSRARRRCGPSTAPFDIVITTNSGYPLDQNLYQAVKGMSAAAEIVRPGGTIICAAECRDGLPDHGSYGRLLQEGRSPARPPRADRRLAGDHPRPMAGPDPGPGPDEGGRPAPTATA